MKRVVLYVRAGVRVCVHLEQTSAKPIRCVSWNDKVLPLNARKNRPAHFSPVTRQRAEVFGAEIELFDSDGMAVHGVLDGIGNITPDSH